MRAPIRIYVIAGEASGDHHAGLLIQALRRLHPELEIRGWGGPALQSAGAQLDVHYTAANFMGFVEVVRNLPRILGLFRKTKAAINSFNPDLLLLVDYPGFNLRMAKWAHRRGLSVNYFIAPQVWAWKERRVRILRECVQKLFVVLPFEVGFFNSHGISATYHGHPLAERIHRFAAAPGFRQQWKLDKRSIITLVPGSRTQEIRTLLPIYLRAVRDECKYQIAIAGLRQHQSLYESILNEEKCTAAVVYEDMYNLLRHSRLAVVTSGTASLETALFKIPMVVCYKGNFISYHIARHLIKVPFISLANLLAGNKIVEELIQDQCHPARISQVLQRLKTPIERKQIHDALSELDKMLYKEHCYELLARDFLLSFRKSV